MSLTEYQAIQKINTILAQGGTDYKVSKIRSASWGWVIYTEPFRQEQVLYGSSAFFLVHKNGVVKEQNDVCFRFALAKHDINGIIKAFLSEAQRFG